MDLPALFKHLDRLHDRSTKELLVQAGIVKSFETGEELLRTGQYIRHVPIVLKGSLKVTREDDSGREILKTKISDYICKNALPHAKQRIPTAICTFGCRLFIVLRQLQTELCRDG